MRATKKYLIPAIIATAGIALAGCAPTTPEATTDDLAPVNIAMVYSQSGPLAAYGEAYINGFEAGLDYATEGTGEVDGRELNIERADDAGDADKAVSLVKDYIGQGFKIIAGTASSGIALAVAEQAEQNKILYISGPAAADAITGINEYTFRSGRQTQQDVATAGTFVGDPSGKNIVVFAQDNAFGQGNVAGVDAVLGAKGATVSSVLVPEDATEFTPFAQQVLQSDADLVFVAWAGATSGAMWQSLSQQGVFDAMPVVTGLGDISTFGAYGEASDKISFLNHYFAGASDNAENQAMIEYLEANGHQADLFSPDGFNAALMIVRAISEGGGEDVDKMIESLEGWSFTGPKGETTIRAEDHAMIQPMYQAKLVADGDTWKPELVEVVDAETVAPAIVK
ncbi:substrate-binding domain-containing protein [Homoserinimonas sp. A520]